MIAPHLDFQVLKRTVTVEQVLAARGIDELFKKRGDRLIGPCPIHGGDNPTAFVVSISKNLWHCFSGCQAGGDVVELVRRLDHISYRETAERLASLASSSSLSEPTNTPRQDAASPHADQSMHQRLRKRQPPMRCQPSRPYTRRLDLDPTSSFLRDKGISASTARSFEAGVYSGLGFLQGCVGVRLHDLSGNPLGYAGRRLNSKLVTSYGKWKLPKGLPKSQILYGYHRVAAFLDQSLCIVEGPWDVMRLHQIGVPAVAILGAHLSAAQHLALRSASSLVILLDGDATGRTASLRIKRTLNNTTDVRIVILPDRLDPDDLSDQQLRSLLANVFQS